MGGGIQCERIYFTVDINGLSISIEYLPSQF
jgi:hypothetical protein